MPPNDYGMVSPSYHDGDYATSGDIATPIPLPDYYANPRFARDKLDATGQKLYDQLKAQREAVAKKVTPEEYNQLYGNLRDLTPDESLALMASKLKESGITDINKVKTEQVTERIPVQYGEIGGSGEGGGYWSLYYIDPVRGEQVAVSENQVKGLKYIPGVEIFEGGWSGPTYEGYIEQPKTQYINTETGKPLTTSVGGRFAGEEGFLQTMDLGDKVTSGFGVQFTPDGIPLYYQSAYKDPSSWKRFTNSLREMAASPVGKIALALALGPQGAGLSKVAAAAGAGGLSSLAAEGDLGKALKSAALGGALAYGGEQLFGGPSFDPSSALETQLLAAPPTADLSWMDAVSPGQVAAIESGLLPGEAGIQQILSNAGINVTPADTAAAVAETFPAGQIPSNTPFDFGPDNFFGEPTLEELAQLSSGPTPSPDLSYLNVSPAQEAAAAGTDTGPLPGMETTDLSYLNVSPAQEAAAAPADTGPLPGMETTDLSYLNTSPAQEAAAAGTDTGALPGAPMTPAATAAALAAGGTGDPYIASEIAGSAPSSWDPSWLTSAAAFAASPAGKLLLSLGGSALINKMFGEETGGGPGAGPQGWSGQIPQYTAVRERVPVSDVGRRPGEYGRRYFSDTTYVPTAAGAQNLTAAQGIAQLQAAELAKPPIRAASGGLMGLAKGRYLNGTTDGMEDKVPADIDGQQPARLSHGEFVIPADVVSHLGNGNSDAGAKRLYDMMDRIRHARTGTKKQGKQINANKYLPV